MPVYLNLPEIFEDRPKVAVLLTDLFDIKDILEDKEEYRRAPDRYPYLVKLVEDETPDMSRAKVADNFRPEFKKKILDILYKYKGLFRPGLGQFNDSVNMPILFKLEETVDRLKQVLYNMSKKD